MTEYSSQFLLFLCIYTITVTEQQYGSLLLWAAPSFTSSDPGRISFELTVESNYMTTNSIIFLWMSSEVSKMSQFMSIIYLADYHLPCESGRWSCGSFAILLF